MKAAILDISPTGFQANICGNRVCTVPINEFGTSSRCPACKDKTKVVRIKKEDCKNQNATTSPRCKSEDFVSRSTKDVRMETCAVCKNKCGHDKISTLNMLYIVHRPKDALRRETSYLADLERVVL